VDDEGGGDLRGDNTGWGEGREIGMPPQLTTASDPTSSSRTCESIIPGWGGRL